MNFSHHAKFLVKKLFNKFGLRVTRYESEISKAKRNFFEKWETLSQILAIHIKRLHERKATELESNFINFLLENFNYSQSQLFQDILVMFLTDKKREGYFVEFGATNGLSFSNTYTLESQLGWYGILSEPAITWHRELSSNRKCHIDFRCVWGVTGDRLMFKQTQIAELSTVTEMSEKDNLASSRIRGREYLVNSITLNDLLSDYEAPKIIDLLSIDTEGSEFTILNSFNFESYQIKIICVEHNYNNIEREKIKNLLLRNNYLRILEPYSLFDDWYINKNFFSKILN